MSQDKTKERKRVVVEELTDLPTSAEPIEEVKEKVEELQGITEHMSGDIEKSVKVQEQIAEAAEKVESKDEDFKGPNPLLILIPGILLLGVFLGGIYFYQKNVGKEIQLTVTPMPTAEATPIPSSSPSAKLDLTKYSIVVQNGSGTIGEAGKVKDLLTIAGFKVGTTGNAATYDFTKTVIKTKKSVEADYITKLTAALGKTYVVDTTVITLADSSKDSVIVIVGTSKAN